MKKLDHQHATKYAEHAGLREQRKVTKQRHNLFKKIELDAFSKDTNVARMYCRPYPWGCMLITPVHALKHELSSGSMPLKLNTARVAIEACTRDSYWSDSYEFLDAFELV